MLPPVARRWPVGTTVIVAGSGPSLTPEVAELCDASGAACVAVSDAHRLMPWADVLYSCDAAWWNLYDGMLDFRGERWSSHSEGKDDKLRCALRWHLQLVAGIERPGFSGNPALIHYGQNSGYQAINLALHMGATRVLLVGYNMKNVGQRNHFFGRHPSHLRNSDPTVFIKHYDRAAKLLPHSHPQVRIINCTENSALKCWPYVPLAQALTME